MTNEEADAAQQWAGMPGTTAWLLIERHADGWDDIGAMMDAWLRANVQAATLAERDRCIDLVAMFGGSVEIEAAIRRG